MEKNESASKAAFESVLDRQLERLLGGHATIDECCQADPEYADELRPLLELAALGQASFGSDVAGSGSESVAREKLMSQARSFSSSRKPGSWRRLRPIVLVTGSFLLLFAGTAFAAESAEPDSFLYPVKQRMESARTTLAMQDADQARKQTEHANNRLDELQKMIDEGKSEYTGSLLADYDSLINDASAHAAAAAAAGEDIADVSAFIISVRARHDEMMKTFGINDENEDSGGGIEPGEDTAGGGQEILPENPAANPSDGDYSKPDGSEDSNHSGSEGGSGGYEQPDNGGHSGGDSDSGSERDGGKEGASDDESSHDMPKQEKHA